MDIDRTLHAQVRHQGRATIPLIEALVLDYGTWERTEGAWIVFVDKATRKRLRRALGGDRGLRLIEGYTKQYLVVADDGRIITTGCRTKHITRH